VSAKTDAEDDAIAHKYSRLLQFMHWATEQPEAERIPFGELIDIGVRALKLEPPGESVRAALLRAIAKFVLNDIPYTTVTA